MASPFIQSPFATPHSASPSSSPVIVVVVDSDGLENSFFASTNAEGEVESKGSSATSTISSDWGGNWNGVWEWGVGWVWEWEWVRWWWCSGEGSSVEAEG